MALDERRQYRRVTFPPGEGPTLSIGGEDYEVLDVSPQAVRFRADNGSMPDIGSNIAGVVKLSDDAHVAVDGLVMRVHGKEAVVVFGGHGLPVEKLYP